MKVKYLIPISLVVLVFSLISCCFPNKSTETIPIPVTTITLPSESPTMSVKYIVLGYNSNIPTINPQVSVTYSNSQGGTEQINGIELKKLISELGLDENAIKSIGDFPEWRSEIIASYENFPKNEFMYISAQNQKDYGNTLVIILIKEIIVWKYSIAKGGYSIATASGVYGE